MQAVSQMMIISVKRRALVLLSCFLLSAPAFTAVFNAEAKDWTTPVAISTAGTDISNARVVVSNDGTAVIIWVEEPIQLNPPGSIKYAVKSPGQKKFSASQTLFTTTEANGIPNHEARIAIDGSGNAIAVWLSRTSGASEDALLYAVKPSGSAVFGDPVALPRTGVTANAKPQFDFDISANDAGTFWVADPLFIQGAGARIGTWKGGVGGFGEAEFASPSVSSSNANDRPLLAVTPEGNAYLYYQSFTSPTKAFLTYHNGTNWFSADSRPSASPKGIQIGTGGSLTDASNATAAATADGGVILTFREDATYGLYTNFATWTTDGTTGTTNSAVVPLTSEENGYTATSDSTGNGLLIVGSSNAGKGGFTTFFVNSSGIGSGVFLKAPNNTDAFHLGLDMDPSGNAILAFGTSSSVKKSLYLAYRAAGASKKFVVEKTITTPKGVLPAKARGAFGPKNNGVVIYTALDKSNRETLYYTTRTNKNPPKKNGKR